MAQKSLSAGCWPAVFQFLHDVVTCRDSSVGRASDWRSEGPWFKSGELARALNNPGSRHWIFPFPFFFYFLGAKEWVFFFLLDFLTTSFKPRKIYLVNFTTSTKDCVLHIDYLLNLRAFTVFVVSKVFYSRSCHALSHTRLNWLPFFALICSPQSSFPVYLRRR